MSDRTFERAVLDWLEDGSDRTPRPAIDAVLLAVKTTPQERGPWIPRRNDTMSMNLRLVAGIALVAVLGIGALAFVGGGPGFGGDPTARPSPTAPPTASPAAPGESGVPAMTEAFSSPAFGYDVKYPAGWQVRAGTTQGSATDVAIAESGPARFWDHFGANVIATTAVVPRDVTQDQWIAAYQAPQVAQAGRACIPEPAAWEAATIDGRAGHIYVGCDFVEALVFEGRRVYVFSYLNQDAPQSAVETTGRRLLEAFIATVTLHPERVSTPPPAPAATDAP